MDGGMASPTDPVNPQPTQEVPAPITTTTSVRIFTRSETTTIVNPASTVTVVSVVPVPSSQLVPDSVANSHLDSTTAFFRNTPAVVATFTVVGLAIIGILAFCLIRSVRYHRRRLDESTACIEAARPATVLGDTDSEDAHRIAERRSVAGMIGPGEKRESRLRYSTMGLTTMDMAVRGSMEKASLNEYYDATGARRTSMSGKRVSSSPSVAQRESMMLNARSYSAAADFAAGGSLGPSALHRLPPEIMGFGAPPSAYPAPVPVPVRASTSLDMPRSSSSGARRSTDSQRVGFEARRPSVDYLENGLGYPKWGKPSQSDLSSEAGQFYSTHRRPSIDQMSTSSSSFAGHFSKGPSSGQLKDWTEGVMRDRVSGGERKGKQKEVEVIEMGRRRRSVQGSLAKTQHTPHASLGSATGMTESSVVPPSATTGSSPSTPISQRITNPLMSPPPPSSYTRSNSRGSLILSPPLPPPQAHSNSPKSLLRALSPPPASTRSNSSQPTITKRSSRRPSTAPSLLSVGESESKFRPSDKNVRKASFGTAESGGSDGSEPPRQRSFVVMGRRPSTAPQATTPGMSIFGTSTTTTTSSTATPSKSDEVLNSPSKFRITNLADDDELDSSSTGHGHDRPTSVDEPRPVTYDSRKASISSSIPTLSRASTFSRPSMGSRPSTSGTGAGDDDEDLYPTFGRALVTSPTIPPLEINHPGPSRRPQQKARSSSSSSLSRPSTAPTPSVPTLLTPAPKKRRPSTSTATSSTSGSTARPSLWLDPAQGGMMGHQQNLVSPAVTSSTSGTSRTTTPSPSPRPSPGLSNAASTSSPTPTTATTTNPYDTPLFNKTAELDYFSSRPVSVNIDDPSSMILEPYTNPPMINMGLHSIAESDAAWMTSATTSPVSMEFVGGAGLGGSSTSPPTSPIPKRGGGGMMKGRNSSGSQPGRSSSGSQEGVGPAGSRASVDTTWSSLRDDHDYTPGRLAGLKVANA